MGYNLAKLLCQQIEEALTYLTEKKIMKMQKTISIVQCIVIIMTAIAFISMAIGEVIAGELISMIVVQTPQK